MALITKPNTFTADTDAVASEVNDNFDEIYDEFNGAISAANLATDAVTTAKITDSNVTTAKIADENVTSRKLAPNIVIETCTGDVAISSTTPADITGCSISITPAIASTALVIGVFDVDITTATDNLILKGILDVDGSDETSFAIMQNDNASTRATVSQTWLVNLTAASHTLKLQAAFTSAGSTVASVKQTHTRIMLVLLGDANATIS